MNIRDYSKLSAWVSRIGHPALVFVGFGVVGGEPGPFEDFKIVANSACYSNRDFFCLNIEGSGFSESFIGRDRVVPCDDLFMAFFLLN